MGRFDGESCASYLLIYCGISSSDSLLRITPKKRILRWIKFQLHEFCVKFIKKKHGNDGYYKYFVTFALDYENMN